MWPREYQDAAVAGTRAVAAAAAALVETSKYTLQRMRKEGWLKFSFALSSSSPLQAERGREEKGNFLEGINFVSALLARTSLRPSENDFPSFFNFDAGALAVH